MENALLIPLNGLTAGKTEFEWSLGKDFFLEYDNDEILDARLNVGAIVEKSGRYTGVDVHIKGFITVECDRCLGDLQLPINPVVKLSLKYGQQPEQEQSQEGEREEISLASDEAEFDLGQIVYDYACLALPMHRVHPDGECDEKVIAHLIQERRPAEENEAVKDNPFASLEGLFK